MGIMSSFEPNFTYGTSNYVYDCAVITYIDGSTKEVRNLASNTEYRKNISQVLHITYIPTSIRLRGNTDVFISGQQNVISTKILLAPHDINNNIIRIEFRQDGSPTRVIFEGNDFIRWCRLTSNYYKSIIISSKSTGSTPYEIEVHEADINYSRLTKDDYNNISIPSNKYATHFNQIKYGNIINDGEMGSSSLPTGDIEVNNPRMNCIRIDSNFTKTFMGFQKVNGESELINQLYYVFTLNPLFEWDLQLDPTLKFEIDNKIDNLFTINSSNKLVFNRELLDSISDEDYSRLDRMIKLRYTYDGIYMSYVVLQIQFVTDLILTDLEVPEKFKDGSNSPLIRVNSEGWYPLPWSKSLNRIDERYLGNVGLSLQSDDSSVIFDSIHNRFYVKFNSSTDTSVHNMRLVSNSNTLMYNGQYVTSIPFRYQRITWSPIHKNIECKFGLTRSCINTNGILEFPYKDNFYSAKVEGIPEGPVQVSCVVLGLDYGELPSEDKYGYPGEIRYAKLVHPKVKTSIASKLNQPGAKRLLDCTQINSNVLLYYYEDELDYDSLLGEYQLEINSTLFGKRLYTLRISKEVYNESTSI